MRAAILLALLCIGAGRCLTARADMPAGLGCVDKANTYCLIPVTAAGWQIGLAKGSVKNLVMLQGMAVQHTFGSLTLGLGGYVGLGTSSDAAGSYQACGGISVTSWGLLCVGPQWADGDRQIMVTFAPQLSWGGSPAALKEAGVKVEAW